MLADFAWRRRGRGQHREHYLANKQRYVNQAAARKKALRRERTGFLIAYFAEHPCTDCGERDPVVLEFDHVDASAKSFDVATAILYRSWQSLLDEIAKCEVVCANCHRRRTSRRKGALRTVMTQT